MEFFETVETRQSVRVYTKQTIEAEKLDAILRATNRAPSAGNFQAFEVYVVENAEKREALTKATFGQDFVGQAPVVLVFCSNPAKCQYDQPELYGLEDASIACTFAMLSVTALGLSACWVGAFKAEDVATVIGAPKGQTPVAILPIGYPNEQPERTSRRPLNELVHKI